MAKTPDYFRGKTIIVTGAASGIGRATAAIFAREGANVVCADLNEAGNRETADAITAAGGGALAVTTDVRDRAAVDALIGAAIAGFGQVHFQFNAAGAAMRRSRFLDIDAELWEQAFALNATGVFHCMQAVLPHMLDRGFGVIVNVSSMSYKRGGPGASVHYAAAKGAVWTLTLGVAREFAGQGIRCLAVAPGPIDTPFQDAAATSPAMKEQFRQWVPMKRFGTPEEIGELVLFMCSDACEFMTADMVHVSGGGGYM